MGQEFGHTVMAELKEENITEEEIKWYYKKFSKIDADESGQIELDELLAKQELKSNPIVCRIFDLMDKNKDNKVSFKEFVLAFRQLVFQKPEQEEEKMKFLFNFQDMNSDGQVSNGDLFKAMQIMVGNNLTDSQLQNLVDRTIIHYDHDYDGKLSFIEFKEVIVKLKLQEKVNSIMIVKKI